MTLMFFHRYQTEEDMEATSLIPQVHKILTEHKKEKYDVLFMPSL